VRAKLALRRGGADPSLRTMESLRLRQEIAEIELQLEAF
jgi:hypothetical protein